MSLRLVLFHLSKAKKKEDCFGAIFLKNRCGRAAFYFNFYSAENR